MDVREEEKKRKKTERMTASNDEDPKDRKCHNLTQA